MDKKIFHTPEYISGFVRQFQPIRIFLTAYELDIFTALGKAPKTAYQVASQIKTDPRATDRLLNALCVMGYVAKRKNKFFITKESSAYLIRGKAGYMAGLMHQVNLWDSWTTLTDAVRQGSSVFHRPEKSEDRENKWRNAFIDAMHYRAKEKADGIISLISLKNVQTVLDVGGGSGVFLMAFVKADKNIHGTVFDLPGVIPITKKYVRKEKLASKIGTVAGDYNKDPLPKGFDLVFLSAIIHSNSYERNNKLIRKCAGSLNHGGRVIVKDQVMDESRIKPERGTIFSLNMLVGTQAGDTYTDHEIKEWFDHAGLRFEKRINIPGDDSVMIARKK